MEKRNQTLFLTQFSMLLALEAIVCFTPLGSLPALGPIVATLMMVPVVITGILLGTAAGAAMGAFAGLFSFIVWTYMPPFPPMAFIFTPLYSFGELRGNFFSLVICFVPRILSGVVASVVYLAMTKKQDTDKKSGKLALVTGAALGSLTNTFGVLGGIFLFFGKAYAQVAETVYEAVLALLATQVLTNGIPEAIVAAVSAAAVCTAVKKAVNRVK